MTDPVFLAGAEALAGAQPGAQVELVGAEAHHAVTVRRTGTGEQVVLTDGAGTAVRGEVAQAGRDRLVVRVASVGHAEPPQPRVIVVQAIPKQDRAAAAVEMLTEAGVDRVVPWAAARCVAVWRGDRAAKGHARWSARTREAAKQARRLWVPEVAQSAGLDEVVGLVRRADLAVVLHETGPGRLAGLSVPPRGEVVVVVGPEGGLTEREVGTLGEAGAEVVRLGDTVLRTSTAGVAAVAALLSRTPRWS